MSKKWVFSKTYKNGLTTIVATKECKKPALTTIWENLIKELHTNDTIKAVQYKMIKE